MHSRVTGSELIHGKTNLELLIEIRWTFPACTWMREIRDGCHRPGAIDEGACFGKEGAS
jgi:hypothetical protein